MVLNRKNIGSNIKSNGMAVIYALTYKKSKVSFFHIRYFRISVTSKKYMNILHRLQMAYFPAKN